jgi:glycosyltransferase involved in cell wall biosynthesis
MKVSITCGRKFHSDHVAAALLRKGSLEKVVTANPPRTYRRHSFPDTKLVHTFPYYVPGLLAGRWKASRRIGQSLDWWATRRFDRAAATRVGNPDALISWAWSAFETFKQARQRNILCILEECGSANQHQEQVLAEEHQLLGIRPHPRLKTGVIENERAECELADIILCPSDYVADSFSIYGVPREKCLVIPYASNPKFAASGPKDNENSKLQILYTGSVGSRKGIIYLLRALELLDPESYECTVIGRVDPDFAPIFKNYLHLVRHIPSVPHAKMPEYFKQADVFILPTLDEGMALVIMEALSSGTPVITTAHSGAVGKVIDGKNGFIVPIRDHECIARSIQQLYREPDLRRTFSVSALATAGAWSWDDYVTKLLASISGTSSSSRAAS